MFKIPRVVALFPLLISAGAIVLFIIGYVAHSMVGAENPIEEIAEDLLQKDYNITVEFSKKGETK